MLMTQASRIISKFGNATKLASAIGYSKQAVYRWTYPKERFGSNGYVPGPAIPLIKDAAELLGVELTPEDWAA